MDRFPNKRLLFNFLGVPFYVTPLLWVMAPLWLTVGFFSTFLFAPVEPIESRLVWTVVYAILGVISETFVHLAGHIISGRSVNAAMDAAILHAYRVWNIYNDPPDAEIPPPVHLRRAIGGPVANLILSLIALSLFVFTGAHVLNYLAVLNLLLGLMVLPPIPTFDGEIIWREWRRLRKSN